MTRKYSVNDALTQEFGPIVDLLSPVPFSLGATSNSITVPTSPRPTRVMIEPEAVHGCFRFNLAAAGGSGAVLMSNHSYVFPLHQDVRTIHGLAFSDAGKAFITWLYGS